MYQAWLKNSKNLFEKWICSESERTAEWQGRTSENDQSVAKAKLRKIERGERSHSVVQPLAVKTTFQRGSKQASLYLWGAILLCSGCTNMPFVKINKAPSRMFLTDFSTAWTSAMESISGLSQGKDVIRLNNRDTGILETTWIDNSESRQFLDVFSDEDFFLRARYRLQVQIREGKRDDEQAVMVRVLRFQQKETTFLGGWQDAESDGLEESIYLYRIGRLIAIQQYNEDQIDQARKMDDEDTLF